MFYSLLEKENLRTSMKNTVGIIILLILILAAYFIYDSNSLSTSAENDFRDFAIKDTAQIDQIFMSQQNGNKVLISRRDTNKWLVNQKFVARPDAIDLILRTVNDIKIRQKVSDATFNHVIKRLAGGATKVEIFLKNESKPHKVWYIGDASADNEGTYMLLEKDGIKSNKPYITHRLMEKGYLGSRFFVDPILWRDRVLLKTNPKNINSIKVVHHADTLTSFLIDKIAETKFEITNLKSGVKTELNPNFGVQYFKRFSGIFYEYRDVKTPKEELDSIFSSPPRNELTLTFSNRQEWKVKNYYLPAAPGATVNDKPIWFHPERMYTYCSDHGEDAYFIVQNLTFDPLIPSIEAFSSSTNVEK